MNVTILIIIAALLTVLVAVFAYNMIQESRYRNKIRNQFGHSDRDALMNSQTQSVRDGQVFSHEHISATPHHAAPAMLKPSIVGKTPAPAAQQSAHHEHELSLNDLMENPHHDTQPEPQYNQNQNQNVSLSDVGLEVPEPSAAQNHQPAQATPNSSGGGFMSGLKATFSRMLNSISDEDTQPANPTPANQPNQAAHSSGELEEMEEYDESGLPAADKLLIEFDELKRARLAWFDKRIDYLSYVSLRTPQELVGLPRLSNRYRFQMVGCTMDGLFQIAEPIPGVQYQAFIIGLQAINRNGLISERDLQQFGQQVEHFAESMDGEALLENVPEFLHVAKPIDELCARVDQIIAIHLVSRVSILGSELRNSLEKLGFHLQQDGTFGYLDNAGDVKFSAVTLDGSQFTPQLLASQPYKGFSMLFDITHVPQGEHHFDEYINLTVKLSQALHLELVDDQIQQISTEWLKNIRSFVLDRQIEMIQAHIPPGSELAQRVFS